MKPIGNYLTVKFDRPKFKTKSGLVYLGTPQKSNLGEIVTISGNIKDLKVGDKVMINKASEPFFKQALVRQDEEPLPYLCDYYDVMGKLGDSGLVPLRNNTVVLQPPTEEKVGHILIPKHNDRSRRQSAGTIKKIGAGCEYVTKGLYVVLGQYSGIYFEDTDGIEKVLVSENEILAVLSEKINIDVKYSQQHLDTEGFDQSLHRITS